MLYPNLISTLRYFTQLENAVTVCLFGCLFACLFVYLLLKDSFTTSRYVSNDSASSKEYVLKNA